LRGDASEIRCDSEQGPRPATLIAPTGDPVHRQVKDLRAQLDIIDNPEDLVQRDADAEGHLLVDRCVRVRYRLAQIDGSGFTHNRQMAPV
jgi:hypothetical protein